MINLHKNVVKYHAIVASHVQNVQSSPSFRDDDIMQTEHKLLYVNVNFLANGTDPTRRTRNLNTNVHVPVAIIFCLIFLNLETCSISTDIITCIMCLY